MERKARKRGLSFNNPSTELKEVREVPRLVSPTVSVEPERARKRMGSRVTMASSGKASFQSPQAVTIPPAIIGPNREEIDLTNCPAVRILAVFSRLKSDATRGFNETCSRVLLIPNSEKPTRTQTKR